MPLQISHTEQVVDGAAVPFALLAPLGWLPSPSMRVDELPRLWPRQRRVNGASLSSRSTKSRAAYQRGFCPEETPGALTLTTPVLGGIGRPCVEMRMSFEMRLLPDWRTLL